MLLASEDKGLESNLTMYDENILDVIDESQVGKGLTAFVPSSNRRYGFPVYYSPMPLPHCRG